MSADRPLEEVIVEPAFAVLLQGHLVGFARTFNALEDRGLGAWSKRDFYELSSEAAALESFLDDHGAKFNRTFSLFRELVASVRWLSVAGFSVAHMEARLESYGIRSALDPTDCSDVQHSMSTSRHVLSEAIVALSHRAREECGRLAIQWDAGRSLGREADVTLVLRRLPRNLGQEELTDDTQRIAEIASKYIAACDMLDGLGLDRIRDPEARRRKLATVCKEEQARVYEATVHNLQSTYDTYIKHTVVEGRDERLPRLRGHLSAALHLLEATTVLSHFVERHELEVRGEAPERVIARLVERAQVQDVILNHLLHWANFLLQKGRAAAEELLPNYIEMRELHVELPSSLKLHARPAALIVNIVGHHGTPVEMEVASQRCNAGSILELLIAVGSHPEARDFRFRGDVNPLRDIGLLFEHGLGEHGIENLPAQLQYLKPSGR